MGLTNSLKDLDVAERAIERMAKTKSFTVFTEAWVDFLFRIERAWEQAERSISTKSGFQQWFKPYALLIKKDPLLIFLKQARNAETHGISKTIDKPIRLLFKDKFGRSFGIKKVEYELNDGKLTINIDTPDRDLLLSYGVSVIPADPHLIKFKNRGVWYHPPKKHLGNQLRNLHPVDAAKLGLAFYRGFIQEAMSKWTSHS